MEWKRFQNWCDSLDVDEVAVTTLLDKFDFPPYRLGGYVNPSGEPTVEVSHLRDVADRYGDVDGNGHGGPSEASDDDGLQLSHNTTVPDDNKDESEEPQSIRETIKKINAIHGSDTAE